MGRWSEPIRELAFHVKAPLVSYTIFLGLALLLAAASCTQPSANISASCPTPPPVITGPNALETFVAHADVIVVGAVSEGKAEILAGRSFYRDWELDVEQFVTEPLAYDNLTIRTFTAALDSAGNVMPVKSPTLAQGQEVLLFLDKDWDEPPLADHEFTIVDLYGGTFWIRDGKVDIRYFDESEEYVSKDLDAVINRITDLVDACR